MKNGFVEGNNKRNRIYGVVQRFDPGGRWRMFSYGGDGFKINADPILGVEIGSVKDESISLLEWNLFVWLYL